MHVIAQESLASGGKACVMQVNNSGGEHSKHEMNLGA